MTVSKPPGVENVRGMANKARAHANEARSALNKSKDQFEPEDLALTMATISIAESLSAIVDLMIAERSTQRG